MQDLSGHTALITGAGARIGQAIALELIARGATVVVHYRQSAEGAHEVVRAAADRPGRAIPLQADLADPVATEQLMARAVDAAGGPVDWLVNNASVYDNLGLEATTLPVWEHSLMINLTAPFLLSRDFAAHQRALPQPGGAIVNMLDFRATHPGADHFAYTVAKAALAAMTKSLAQALGPQMRCNGIALGNILPPIDNSDDGIKKGFVRTPLRRRGTLDDVVETVIFLLAGPAFITGDILYLDGGRHLT